MSVDYRVVGRKKPNDTSAPKKFYTSAKSNGKVGLRQLSNQISNISTVSSIDTMAVLEAMVQVIPENIADGKVVALGDFGNFRLTLQSEGAAKAVEVNASNIKGNKLRFLPGKEIKKVLNNIDYKKVE